MHVTLSVMQFSDRDIEEYRQIWKEEFQEEISFEEASHSASILMGLFALLCASIADAVPRSSEGSLPDHRT